MVEEIAVVDSTNQSDPFKHGSEWVRADFHLHTKADKEFVFSGEDNTFISEYIQHLESAHIRLGVITNHNKFDVGEFKALRKKAKKSGIGLLPGVELSVNDGANGVHTLIVFSDQWLADGQDYINQFLNVTFSGKTPAQYEQENGRTNDDLLTTLKTLEGYNRDFFIVFAHVEASSGLWKEISGGRMQELANKPLIQKYCLGFQKVRTHDLRSKVHQWWGTQYPAEVEGSDPKKLEEIGRGKHTFLKIGDYSFDAVKYALSDYKFRVCPDQPPTVKHSHVNAIRFEGGLFDGKQVTFSPHLNCLIGIQGSGKSSILECLRYALDIKFGEVAQDKDYKDELIRYVLKSGGKIVVEATDRHGTKFEIRRILDHEPDVYVNDELQPGVSIRETVINRPLYFGQKDLAAAGKKFGYDLVEKLVGDGLGPCRQTIAEKTLLLKSAIQELLSIQSDADQLDSCETELNDVKFRLQQFDKHGVKGKLEKRVEFGNDISFCESVDEIAAEWQNDIASAIDAFNEAFENVEEHTSKYNKTLFTKYNKKLQELRNTVVSAKTLSETIDGFTSELSQLRVELENTKDSLKEEFADVERELVKSLESVGVTSIQPNTYIDLTERENELTSEIMELKKNTSKHSNKHQDVLKAVAKLNDAWHEEFKFISVELEKINSAQPSLQIESTFKGEKVEFRSKMEQEFRGSNIRHEYYKTITDNYVDFADIYKDLEKASAHAKSNASTFSRMFVEKTFDLLSFQVPNKYDVTYHGRALKSHSLGQRASAMMLFLLSQSDIDLLLIDQPEDDLDSQTVYEEVVKLLRKIKPDQQFIFATHNANFPVLGDAETVTSCSVEEETFFLVTGSVDNKECQSKIIRIMEGGPEAFERRKSIYQIWNSEPVT